MPARPLLLPPHPFDLPRSGRSGFTSNYESAEGPLSAMNIAAPALPGSRCHSKRRDCLLNKNKHPRRRHSLVQRLNASVSVAPRGGDASLHVCVRVTPSTTNKCCVFKSRKWTSLGFIGFITISVNTNMMSSRKLIALKNMHIALFSARTQDADYLLRSDSCCL